MDKIFFLIQGKFRNPVIDDNYKEKEHTEENIRIEQKW